jgi:Domain of unknown function (DUF4388)
MSTMSQTKFRREELVEVLKYMSSSQAQGRLALSKDGTDDLLDALIYFDAGRILAARCGSLAGLEAISEVFGWDSGHFDFIPEPVALSSLPKVIWVNLTLTSLLIEINKATSSVSAFAITPAPSSHGVLNVNSIPRLIEQNSGMQVQVAPATFQLFPYLNGAFRLGHILQATNMTLNTLQSLLQPLLTAGFLELLDLPIAAKVAKPQPAPVAAPQPIPSAFLDDLEYVLKSIIGPFGTVLLEDAADNIGADLDAINSKNTAAWLRALNDLIPSERKQAFAEQLTALRAKHRT